MDTCGCESGKLKDILTVILKSLFQSLNCAHVKSYRKESLNEGIEKECDFMNVCVWKDGKRGVLPGHHLDPNVQVKRSVPFPENKI